MVPDSAVIVWQLRGFVEDVHCFFYPRRAGFALAVERAGERLLDEEYDDLAALMTRAREMKRDLMSAGFTPVDVASSDRTQALDWMLTQFMQSGVALGHASARPC